MKEYVTPELEVVWLGDGLGMVIATSCKCDNDACADDENCQCGDGECTCVPTTQEPGGEENGTTENGTTLGFEEPVFLGQVSDLIQQAAGGVGFDGPSAEAADVAHTVDDAQSGFDTPVADNGEIGVAGDMVETPAEGVVDLPADSEYVPEAPADDTDMSQYQDQDNGFTGDSADNDFDLPVDDSYNDNGESADSGFDLDTGFTDSDADLPADSDYIPDVADGNIELPTDNGAGNDAPADWDIPGDVMGDYPDVPAVSDVPVEDGSVDWNFDFASQDDDSAVADPDASGSMGGDLEIGFGDID